MPPSKPRERYPNAVALPLTLLHCALEIDKIKTEQDGRIDPSFAPLMKEPGEATGVVGLQLGDGPTLFFKCSARVAEFFMAALHHTRAAEKLREKQARKPPGKHKRTQVRGKKR